MVKTGWISLGSLKGENKTERIQSCIQYWYSVGTGTNLSRENGIDAVPLMHFQKIFTKVNTVYTYKTMHSD